MDKVTFWVQLIIGFAGFISACGVIIHLFHKLILKLLEPLYENLRLMDVRECKTYIIDFLNDVENGVEKDEVQIKIAHEIYHHYTVDLGENSYVHTRWESVMGKRGYMYETK